MVTGVEAAGLVLGAIPLIISALENYENLSAPTNAFIHWKRHLGRLIRELYSIHTSYEQAVRLLLKPFADLADQTTMMEDPQSKLWREGDVANGLRERLGPVYGPFIITIDEVSEILVEIAACLNIPGSQQVSAPPLEDRLSTDFGRFSQVRISCRLSLVTHRSATLRSFTRISNLG
jgi:hypothetical protein